MNSKLKNNATADELRVSGNEQYGKGEYFFALMKYNHSLCFAEPGSGQMGFAYGNRSAAYFELKQFDLCLQNIQLVDTLKYPKSRMDKLKDREAKCKEMMKTSKPNPDDDPINFFKLSYPANKKYPGIAECIELRNNEKFGNHLITTKDLKTGDVIAIEDPSFTEDSPYAPLHRCHYCCKDVRLNLIPCPGCTKAMFCSAKCCRDASNEVHQFECSQSNPAGDFHVRTNMRLLLKYLNVFDGNVLELKKFLEDNKKPVTVFDFDFSDPKDPMYQKNMMLVELSMRNAAKMMESWFRNYTIFNLVFIDDHPKLKELWRKHGSFLNDLLEKLMSLSRCRIETAVWVSTPINLPVEAQYADEIRDFEHQLGSVHKQGVGSALHPASLLANGSCDPNILLLPVGNKHVCIVIQPIPAGAQLFRRYASEFYNFQVNGRHLETEIFAGYKCDCKACEYDWPSLDRLPAVDPSFTHDLIRSLSTQEQAKENIKEFAEYIEKNYQHNKPTKEIYICIHNIILEYGTLAKPSFYR